MFNYTPSFYRTAQVHTSEKGRVLIFISQVMSSCWCPVWCTLARCCTGAPDTTTSSSPTSGARDTSGEVVTSKIIIIKFNQKVWRKWANNDNGYSWYNYWGICRCRCIIFKYVGLKSSERRRRQVETTTEVEAETTTETVTTTEIPTTTAEPLPYSLHYLMVPSVS